MPDDLDNNPGTVVFIVYTVNRSGWGVDLKPRARTFRHEDAVWVANYWRLVKGEQVKIVREVTTEI